MIDHSEAMHIASLWHGGWVKVNGKYFKVNPED